MQMRILLIEDHPIVRTACRRLLQAVDEAEIREAATAADGLSVSREFRPTIIVLDLNLPDSSGLALMAPLLLNEPTPKIIVFSMYEEPAFVARAIEAGAKGYITKNDAPDTLLHAINKVNEGGVFLTAPLAEKLALMAAGGGSNMHGLSGREVAVLELLGQGRTLGEIAVQLKISYRTSANLVAQLKSKLNVASNAALIKWAVENSGLRLRADIC
jgi:DNA-binding NarL/FixJ family response regulator